MSRPHPAEDGTGQTRLYGLSVKRYWEDKNIIKTFEATGCDCNGNGNTGDRGQTKKTESVGEYVWSFMTFRVPDTSIWLVNVFLTNYLAATNLIEIKSRLDWQGWFVTPLTFSQTLCQVINSGARFDWSRRATLAVILGLGRPRKWWPTCPGCSVSLDVWWASVNVKTVAYHVHV